MPCSMKMMHITWTDTHIAATDIMKKWIRAALYTTTVTNPTITASPGTVPVDSFVSKSSEITITSGNPTYAGNLKNASELNYYIRVPEAGKYTVTLKLKMKKA